MSKTAVVLLSGGLDSATVLAIAQAQGYACHTLSFDYGQRHRAELVAAQRIATVARVASHRVVRIGFENIGGSALTDQAIAVPEHDVSLGQTPGEGIPVTYVPARNTVFLALALGLAETVGAQDIFVGVNAVDYSGYPDCRPEYIAAFQTLAQLATKSGVEGAPFTIHTPLITLTKAGIVQAGTALGVDYRQTVSCYQADARGYACGRCDSCYLRRKGFEQAGLPDPTLYVETAV